MLSVNAFQDEEHQPFTFDGGDAAALLVHGFPGSPAEMRPLANVLHENGWTTHGPLLPGFGPQIETLPERTHDEWFAAVNQSYLRLRSQYSKVIIIGFSLGGALSMRVAAQNATTHPPDGLIMLSPFWKLQHIGWTMLPVIKIFFRQPRIFKWLRLDFDKQEVRDGIHDFMPDADLDDPQTREEIRNFRMPISMFAQIHKSGRKAYEIAPQITTPTLVLQGQQDELVLPTLTRQMIERIPGDVTYKIVNGEHEINLPDGPDWQQVKAAIQHFAARFYPIEASAAD